MQEYWQYDPFGVLLPHPLQGWKLQDSVYVAIQGQETPEADWRFSEVLGTWWGLLTPDALEAVRASPGWEPRLRLWNLRASRWHSTIRGAYQLRKATEAERDRARAERERAQAERDQALAQSQREAQRNRELAALLARLPRRAPDDDPSS